jgi:membrane protein involved in colicin uptake
MIKHASLLLVLAFLINSCGKKEETQTQQEQQTQQNQQQTQQHTQQQQTTEQNKEADKKKEDEVKKKKEDEEKKKKEEAEKKKKEEAEKKKKEEEMTKKEENNGETTQIDFAPIYSKRCAKCHGANGKGKVEGTPDFTSSKTKSKSDKELFNAIKFGIKAETEDGEDMPAWNGKLTDAEIHAGVKYVKSF